MRFRHEYTKQHTGSDENSNYNVYKNGILRNFKELIKEFTFFSLKLDRNDIFFSHIQDKKKINHSHTKLTKKFFTQNNYP